MAFMTDEERLEYQERKLAHTVPIEYKRTRKPMVKELLSILVAAAMLVWVTLHYHYRLPAPLQATTPELPRPGMKASEGWYRKFFAHELDTQSAPAYHPFDNTSSAQAPIYNGPMHTYFSEANAMMTMQYLSEGIGYRVVGTQQHIDAEAWVESILRRYEGTHATGESYQTEVEVFKQVGDGAHRFEILGHPVWKKYHSMSNLIVRISDGTDEGKAQTLLLNAHLDSTLPSPGAADDAAGVAIMLEALRVLTMPGAPRLKHGLILLFNNGEESLQDASHLYMTQHETNTSVRAVLNMEACGVSGPTLLFQATDDVLINAYAKVPHPFGTVLASDVFSSGVIMSDTDFRQFVEYGLGLPGLDMAIVGSSYLYHTRLDVPAYIERGVMQHFGENVFSLLESLALNPDSQLSEARRWPYDIKRVLPVYFSMFGTWFINMPARLFKNMILSLGVAVNFLLASINTSETRVHFISYSLLSALGLVASYVAAILAANVVALTLRGVNMPLSWFGHEWYALALFTPPAIAAVVGTQLILRRFAERSRRPYLELSTFSGHSIVYTLCLMVMNMYGLGSAYLMFTATLAFFLPLLFNDFVFIGLPAIAEGKVAPDRRVRLVSYFLALLPAATMGAEGVISFLDLLVPLMGRMGTEVPVDHVIGTLVAVLVTLNAGFFVPLCHRYGARFMHHAVLVLLGVTAVTTAFFAMPGVPTFDKTHPRRLLLHHVENITSGEWHVAYSSLDSAKENPAMATELERVLLHGATNHSLSWDDSPQVAADMDILFPLTHFIDTSRVTLPSTPAREAASKDMQRWSQFRVTCDDIRIDPVNATREVVLRLHHPEIAWSTLSFDAEVLDWDFAEAPPSGWQRHHLKDVSRLGANEFAMRLVLKLTPEQVASYASHKTRRDTLLRSPPFHTETAIHPSRLRVHYSGLDAFGMYPHHKNVGMDRLSMQTLAELDAMFTSSFPEIDPMLMSVIAGVAEC
ncbi:metalloexopeptidase [Malassezia pachydermatis]|uniref:Peptide hydrolase n=1 Tax=Malassezia pachydermatis TaxID=77020 RepID=A0A0M9VP61_9BASI|nr:aminopeptidases of the m20 family [Malassezia pachydermatis]KOS14063.1 aminopeptidases of the m20 family [Malassezia pachydermatis]